MEYFYEFKEAEFVDIAFDLAELIGDIVVFV